MKATVNADLFRLAAAAVSKEETRFYLQGVHIEPLAEGGVVMVSTDGHRMIVVHDADGFADDRMLVKLNPATMTATKQGKKETLARTIAIDGNAKTATVMQYELPIAVNFDAIIDGTFPDWRRVVPMDARESADAAPVCLDPAYMTAMGTVGAEVARLFGGTPAVLFHHAKKWDPIAVRFGDDRIFGVIMPKRGDEIVTYLPGFMFKPQAHEAIAA